MGRSVSGAGNSRRLNDEHAVPTIRFARPRSNSLAAIAPARVASSICANSVLLRAQSLWVLFLLAPPPTPPPHGGGAAPPSASAVLCPLFTSPVAHFTPPAPPPLSLPPSGPPALTPLA